MLEYELGLGHLELAEALHAQLAAPEPALTQRLAALREARASERARLLRIERDRDPSVGALGRTRAYLGMGAVTATDSACSTDGRYGVGEKLTLSVPLTNPFNFAITDVSAQVTGGGSANYGTIAAGATVSQNISYQIPINTACGSKVTVSVVVTSNLGTETKTFQLQIGTPTAIYLENFDTVTAPALPAGWTAANTGAMPAFATTIAASDTAPLVAGSS
jgi:hypothetical protein